MISQVPLLKDNSTRLSELTGWLEYYMPNQKNNHRWYISRDLGFTTICFYSELDATRFLLRNVVIN